MPECDRYGRWHDLGGEVVATRFRNAPDSQWVRLLGWPKLMDSPEIDLVDEIKGLADVVIEVVPKMARARTDGGRKTKPR